MNPFGILAGALKSAVWVAESLGMCKGCLIRKGTLILECESCGAGLCPQCLINMRKKHEEWKRRDPRTPDVLVCEACNKKFGDYK